MTTKQDEAKLRAFRRVQDSSREDAYVVLGPTGTLIAQVHVMFPSSGAGRVRVAARMFPSGPTGDGIELDAASAGGGGYDKAAHACSALDWSLILPTVDRLNLAQRMESLGLARALEEQGLRVLKATL